MGHAGFGKDVVVGAEFTAYFIGVGVEACAGSTGVGVNLTVAVGVGYTTTV